MKVILLRDVAKIGKRFEIKEVPDGYALNKLIPKKDAEPATPANLARIRERQRGNDRTEEVVTANATAVAKSCSESPLTILVEANEQGHLFQAIHASDIVTALNTRGFTIAGDQLSFAQPVKSLGEHSVTLTAAGKSYQLPFTVIAK
jgi:large subunit ribosomal protein L9